MISIRYPSNLLPFTGTPLSAAVWAKVCERLAESMRVEPSREWIHGTHQTGKPEDHLPKYLGRGYDVFLPRSVKQFLLASTKKNSHHMDAEWSGFAMIWRSIWIWNKRNAWNNNEKNLEIWNPQRVWFPSMRYLLSRLPSSTGKWPPTARSSGATRKSNAMLFSHLPGSNGKKHIWHNLDASNRLKINSKKHILRENLPMTQLGGPIVRCWLGVSHCCWSLSKDKRIPPPLLCP